MKLIDKEGSVGGGILRIRRDVELLKSTGERELNQSRATRVIDEEGCREALGECNGVPKSRSDDSSIQHKKEITKERTTGSR